MVRSMYSGVSGLRTHQTRMDTIGNNIANVNTYGFKSARTTFRDIYYQKISSASNPTAAVGGKNPSAVGYGTQVGSVDLMMDRSTLTLTGQTMDLAIDGDGFLQVQDAAGNIFYTRAGMINFDASGSLVDMQGNFVLGINGDPSGRNPGSERIQVALPNVQPAAGTVTQTLNKKDYTIKASNNTTDSNLNFNFTTDDALPDNTMQATISSNGIIIKMHPDTMYSDWNTFSAAVNKAVKEANGNKEHAAGDFTISGKDKFPTAGLKAEDICSTDFGVSYGTVGFKTNDSIFGGLAVTKVGSGFSAGGTAAANGAGVIGNLTTTYSAADKLQVDWIIDGKTYRGEVDSSKTGSGTFVLRNTDIAASDNDTIEMKRPSYADLLAAAIVKGGITDPPALGQSAAYTAVDLGSPDAAKPSTPSQALGLSGMAFALRGGTTGGPQTLADMTGISVGPDGIIIGWDSVGKEVVIGRIDLASFANQSGLDQAGSSKYGQSANSGVARLAQPGTNSTGKLVGGSLELSNVDLSREFSDMITTQRGYQANSRIITVSDTMLEELINLKR